MSGFSVSVCLRSLKGKEPWTLAKRKKDGRRQGRKKKKRRKGKLQKRFKCCGPEP